MAANYTTTDEINYLRELAAKGKYEAIEAEMKTLDKRRWDGEGMAVDKEKVRRAGQIILAMGERKGPARG